MGDQPPSRLRLGRRVKRQPTKLYCNSILTLSHIAPVIGGKARKLMKKKTRSKVKYSDDKGEIQGELRIVRRGEMPDLDALLDKLPDKTKVTLELDNSALEFFKREARKRNTSYQRMIRNLVRSYAQSHS